MKFPGFPAGRLRVTPLPDLFFGELLPQIDDLAELKLTLHTLWLLARHKSPLCLSRTELGGDRVLRRSLKGASLDEALARAVQRGTLIELRTQGEQGAVERWFFANTPAGRREAALARDGKLKLAASPATPPPEQSGERPNVFALYEQHIGMLTPLVAEELLEASQVYPAAWIEEAFAIAAQNRKRNWRYVLAILQRWVREGKADKVTGGRLTR